MSEYEQVQNYLDRCIELEKKVSDRIEMACKWLNQHEAEYAQFSTKQIIKDINRPSAKPKNNKI